MEVKTSAIIQNMVSNDSEHRPAEDTAHTEGDKGVLEVQNLSAWYGSTLAVKDVSLTIRTKAITAIIGPSGCVLLDGKDIYAKDIDPVVIRRRIGMVFQKPTPFPTMSIFDNVAAGLRLTRLWSRRWELDRVVESGLRQAALWDEVKDKLDQSGTSLSGGQQQRLCIARALAVEPEIILLDEPCSALDPVATLKIEDLMRNLAKDYTIIIVTHNMQQAARVSDMAAFMMMGEDKAGALVEYGPTSQLFTNPKDKRTEDYITGRFG